MTASPVVYLGGLPVQGNGSIGNPMLGAYPMGGGVPIAYPYPAPVAGMYPGSATPYGALAPSVYPVSNPSQSPAGLSVQVTTSVGLPNQSAYPVTNPAPALYPVTVPVQQLAYPGVASPSFYPMPVYPAGNAGAVVYPTPSPASVTYPDSSYSSGVGVPVLPVVSSNTTSLSNSAWLQKLLEANRLYRSGQITAAEQAYQEVRNLLSAGTVTPVTNGPIVDARLLPTEAQLLWQQVSNTSLQKPSRQTLRTLQSLVRKYPQFVPAYTQLARTLAATGRRSDALALLDQAIARYPDQADLIRSQVETLKQANRWSDAALAALQFVVKNPNSSAASEFRTLAEQLTQQAQTTTPTTTQSSSARSAVLGSVLRGGLDYLVTGQASGPLGALQSILGMVRALNPR